MNEAARQRYLHAIDATRQAGRLALRYFDASVQVQWKENNTPVTIADQQAETLLRDQLLGRFPQDGFLGEESGSTDGASGFRWIIDPIDGTRSFVRGIPLWATLVGLEFGGEPVAGACFLPAFGNDGVMYRALRGDGAYRDDRPIHVSGIGDWNQTQVFYSSLSWFMAGGVREAFLDIVGRSQRQRGFGDFYGFVLVAQGAGELMVEYGVSPWDVAALAPIIEEAGGRLTDWDGRRTIHRPDILASNGLMHEAALQIIRDKRSADFVPENVQNKSHLT
jgi:histidinol-phosphatase